MPDLTVSLTAGQATRLQAAFATPENPTPNMADLKQFVIRQLKAKVVQYERGVAQAAIVDVPFDQS